MNNLTAITDLAYLLFEESQVEMDAEINFQEWAAPQIEQKFNLKKIDFYLIRKYSPAVQDFAKKLREEFNK